jgi:hypothetical protein
MNRRLERYRQKFGKIMGSKQKEHLRASFLDQLDLCKDDASRRILIRAGRFRYDKTEKERTA